MRVTERRDGTIRIEAIGTRELIYGSAYVEDPDPINVGDEGCLVTGHSVSPPALRVNGPTEYSVRLDINPKGIPGNSNASIRRLHGWRGTSDNWCVIARGWRRVESIEPRKRGIGYVVILSVDLRPDED